MQMPMTVGLGAPVNGGGMGMGGGGVGGSMGMGGGGVGGGGMGGGGMGGGGMDGGMDFMGSSPLQSQLSGPQSPFPDGAQINPGGIGVSGGLPDASDPATLKTPRDPNGLYQMLETLTGGNIDFELPLAALQEVTKHVATISRKAAPKLIQQKRAFVRGWHEENKRLHMPGGGGVRRQHSADGVGIAPPMKQDPDDVFAEVDARLAAAQRSITHSELAEHHVDALSEAIAALLNIKLPTMMRDRRSLILSWHAQQTAHSAVGWPVCAAANDVSRRSDTTRSLRFAILTHMTRHVI